MMETMKKLIDIIPAWSTNGIFHYIMNGREMPWSGNTSITSSILDSEYFGNFSGDKHPSPLIDKTMIGDTLNSSELTLLSDVIVALYLDKWSKLWDTQEFEYNPIENYNMVEQMTNDQTITAFGHTNTRTDNLSHSKTGTETDRPNTTETRTDNLSHAKTGTETDRPNTTETRTDNLSHAKTGTETVTPDTTIEDSKSVYAFNSSDAVPYEDKTQTESGDTEKEYNTTDTQTGTQATAKTGTDTKEYNTTDRDTGTQTNVKTGTEAIEYNTTDTNTGTQTSAESGQNTETRNYRLTRSGNIGVTTSQQMIESERNLWLLWDFFHRIVFPDVDRVITINIY